MTRPYLADPDVTLWHGDALEVLRGMADASVDCVVTSPPYWGLRDYGTGQWEGGNPDCEHTGVARRCDAPERNDKQSTQKGSSSDRVSNTCLKCGATRIDQQLGLEPTPDQFVAAMVEVFREVRRVLAAHGTCWVNLGDSYASNGGNDAAYEAKREVPSLSSLEYEKRGLQRRQGHGQRTGLKPKDLVGIPWRVAFALQADGWYLRSDIVWAKPNPMPESVTDRPTKSHEYVFLLTKQPRYYFDSEAVREDYAPKTLTHRGGGKAAGKVGNQDGNGRVASGNFGDWDKPRTAFPRPVPQVETLDGSSGEAPRGPDGRRKTHVQAGDGSIQHRDGDRWPNGGRNIRSVWQIATQPYPEAHFATFPEELARRCILAGCPEFVCRVCGKARERIVDVEQEVLSGSKGRATQKPGANNWDGVQARTKKHTETVGWSDCGCLNEEDENRHAASPGSGDSSFSLKWRPGVVLDPFIGSGTVAKVARDHGRHAVGIDLNAEYLQLAAKRLQQLSLLSEPA